jgi:hypothetical protein
MSIESCVLEKVYSDIEEWKEVNETINWFSGVFNDENRSGNFKPTLLVSLDNILKSEIEKRYNDDMLRRKSKSEIEIRNNDNNSFRLYSSVIARVNKIVYAVDQQYEDILESKLLPIHEFNFPDFEDYEDITDVIVAARIQGDILRESMMQIRQPIDSDSDHIEHVECVSQNPQIGKQKLN